MKLYLVRHGEPKPTDEYPRRPLTDKGRKEVEKITKEAKRLGARPVKILHSGKLRAEQTAEIIADILGLSEGPKKVAGLNPNDDIHTWVSEISIETDELMLVGHLPFMDRLTSLLVCSSEGGGGVLFTCGTMVCLEHIEDEKWVVQWILKPEMYP